MKRAGERAHQACPSASCPHAILIAVPSNTGSGHALIFDLDGVLVHSMPLHVEAWRQYLERADIAVDDLEGAMHGKGNTELVRQWFGDQVTEAVALGHGAAKERLWRELVLAEGIDKFRVLGIGEF